MFKFSSSPEVLQRFRAGEQGALEIVYASYVAEVEGIIRSGAAGLPRMTGADVEDLVHEVFLRAFGDKARKAFDGTRDFGPYLGAIARNLVSDWARQKARERTVPIVDSALQVPAAEHPSEPEWAEPAVMAVVHRYIEELPLDLRNVHEQRYVACRSQDEACRALGISRQQLRTMENRLRQGLERELKRAELFARAEVATGRITTVR